MPRPSHRILILTGPSASGKNAVAAALAGRQERTAVIDVDVLRYMAVSPHKLPAAVAADLDPSEKLDWRIGIRGTVALARSLSEDDFDVIILDILTEASAALYRDALSSPPTIVLLLPALAEARRRHRERGPEPPGSFMRTQSLAAGNWRLSDSDFERLWRQQESFTAADVSIDNTSLSPEQVATRLDSWLSGTAPG